VYKNLQKIVFVLKLGKDGVCRAPVCETKINDVNAIEYYGDAVYHDENPSHNILINPAVPESERDNLQKQIQRVGISQSRYVELKTASQQVDKMTECHIGEITSVRHKEKNPAQVINGQH
jgi:hypothetical protein